MSIPKIVSPSSCCLQLPPDGRIAAVNDLRMYYEIHGEGDPLLLLHAYNASGIFWKPFIPAFSERYRLIIPDIRGHGRTDNPAAGFSHRQVARDTYALLDHLEIGPFRAIGVSTGGNALVHMALQQPARPQAMVLVGSTYRYPESARAVMRQRTEDTLTPEIVEKLRHYHKLGDDQIRALHLIFHSIKDCRDDMNLTPGHLAAVRASTLIVHGDRDTFFPLSIGVDMYRAIPDAYLWTIPNGDHIPIVKHAEAFTHTALEFLRGGWQQ